MLRCPSSSTGDSDGALPLSAQRPGCKYIYVECSLFFFSSPPSLFRLFFVIEPSAFHHLHILFSQWPIVGRWVGRLPQSLRCWYTMEASQHHMHEIHKYAAADRSTAISD